MYSPAPHSSGDLAAMYGPSDKYGSSGGNSVLDTSTSNLGSSITAYKKVICPSRPADSLEYWLQNSKNLSKTGFVEDKGDSSCTSVCFVNLSVLNEDPSCGTLQKKLDEVSPDLQKLINSVRSQDLRENEIVLLSGLTSRKCGPSSQVLWPDEVCLLQRGSVLERKNTNCIILELNKFLLGLELAQENHLQPDTSPLRAEDDTNCSVSSIEEDFLTASEQLEEDSEGEISKGELYEEIKKVRRKGNENFQTKKYGGANTKREEEIGKCVHVTELGMGSEVRRMSLVGNSLDGSNGNRAEKGKCLHEQSEIHAGKTRMLHAKASEEDLEDPATTGQYATNLAECVLQDAFIRLSQADNTFTKEAAVSISAGDPVFSGSISTNSPAASRSWNELPKIVIVQSPDSCDSPTEWEDDSHWPEQESPANVYDQWTNEDGTSGFTQSTLEVALACAASVIGSVSGSQPAEQIKEAQDECMESIEKEFPEHADIVAFPGVVMGTEFSVPSALCGMTQVASAVAVCGLGEQKQGHYPSPSSGLLAVADASTAVALHCSIAMGTSIEKLKDNIARVLLKEAAGVLTSPCTYRNVGEFIESLNEKILSSVSASQLTHVSDIANDDLAHNLSDTILRHSAEEAIQMLENTVSQHSSTTTSDFVTTTTELLVRVLHFTCKKMRDLVQSGELPFNSVGDNHKSFGLIKRDSQNDDLFDVSLSHRTMVQSNERQLNPLCSTEHIGEPISQIVPHNEVTESSALPTEPYCSTNGQIQTKTPCTKQCLKREHYKRYHNEHKAFLARESTITDDERKYCSSDKESMDGVISYGSLEKLNYDVTASKEFTLTSSLASGYMLHPSQAALPVKYPIGNYRITDFADDLAETVVSMATEIAAICLENSNGKQPWFCAWAKGSECLLTPCRNVKRKKETSSGGAVVRRHRPPRLSEIKKKTDEHPELKERLMNRVVDESINLEDTPDPVSAFANEVASKILNLTDTSLSDPMWQGQNLPRNRLHCDRWSRGKASSYESIPEEDLDAKNLMNTLGPGNMLGQPFSRTSSVSKQSSCESITDEFSRFMVNQMENEGREFELLLDYYAGRNASNILNSALQQVSRRNSHLNVKPTCLSKQSSTESITEEFYRYMLKEIDKESKDNYSSRKTAEWTRNLMPPSPRTPFCFRQSSMPCNRSSSARLTVNTPIKANSLDGLARSDSRDFLNIQPISSISSSNLCKSDSCLYQSCQTDRATDKLIHETWSSSIEALMRKNKIIGERTDSVESSPKGSPAHVDSYANRLAVDIVQSGKSLIVSYQDSLESTNKGSFNNKNISQSHCRHMDNQDSLMKNKSISVNQPGLSIGPMEVPLIQIDTEHREEGEIQENIIDKVDPDAEISIRASQTRSLKDTESTPEIRASELPTPLGSSEDSTGSWSQLVNEEEIPEDTSSFLQLSERSTSNGNCSTTSSIGTMDLDAFLEMIPSGPPPDIRMAEEKILTKDLQENPDECTSGLSVGTASCQQEVSVLNIDLDVDCFDSELRTTLQWIAASELGIPTVYFRKSQENTIHKFLEVTRLVQDKSWKVGDIFSALILHCKMQETRGDTAPGFFDWLLELG